MKEVTVAGSGVLGAQIAFQSAFHGKSVIVYDIDKAALEGLPKKWAQLGAAYRRDLGVDEASVQEAASRLSGTDDLGAALANAEILIEAVPENLEIKRQFYEAAAKVAPAKTIFATNSSTLLPSAIASATGRPSRFAALHFGNRIWAHNTAEIMGHAETDPQVFDAVVAFAREIGMVPLQLHKEQPGYILNSLLVPWLSAAMELVVNDVATPEDVDKTWMIAHGVAHGPFAIFDIIGLRTPYQIALAKAHAGDREAARQAAWVKANFIDQNKLGVETGQGFYSYPDPAYASPDLLKA